MFSGDSVVLQNGRLLPFYRVFNMNNRRAVMSAERIKMLAENGIELVCTAHTGIKDVRE